MRSRSQRDLAVVTVLFLAVWLVALYFDLFEALHAFVQRHENKQFDEIILALITASFALTWFAIRRWREADQSQAEIQKYHDVFGHMRIGLVIFRLDDIEDDKTFRLEGANQMASEFTGTDVSALLGMAVDEAFPDLRKLNLVERFAEVIRSGEPFSMDDFLYGDLRIEQSRFSLRAFRIPGQRVGLAFEKLGTDPEMEAKLSHTHRLLEEAQQVAKIGHWELNLQNNHLFWSDENYRIFGIAPGNIDTYEAFLQRVHPDDVDFVKRAYRDSVEKRTEYNIEHRLLMGDGSIKWVKERCRTYYDKRGEPLRSLGTVQDITEFKQTEEKLWLSQARFSSIINQAEVAIVTINSDQRIVLFNPSAERIFGYSQDEVIGQRIEMLMPERYRDNHHKYVNEFNNSNPVLMFRVCRGLTALRKNGEEFPIDGSVSRQQVGDAVEMTIIFRDVSKQVKADELLRKVSKAVEEAGEAVLITDRDGVIEYVNPAFTQITGYSYEEVAGSNASLLKSGAQESSYYERLWNTISRGDVWKSSLIDRRKDGSFYPAMLTISPIHNDAGEITHFVSLQQDMTEQKKLEEQFLQSQKMESIGTLVGGIAHDFNNMLAAIQGNICLARLKVNDPDAINEKLKGIELLSKRAAGIVEQLLTFARKGIVEMRPVSLTALITDALRLGENAVPENISFIKQVTEQEMVVNGDVTQLQQIIMNLLNNARDAVELVEEPEIKASLELYDPTADFYRRHPSVKVDRFAHIVVSDNGCGIPTELIEKVTEPFFTTKGVGKGTGLGMSMVYGAVETHGGVLEIDSREGAGTAVHIYLPVLHELEDEQEQSDESDAVNGRGELILLVDDEKSVREVIGEVLDMLGYQVANASDGKQALDYFREHKDEIDMIISDVVMPVMGGIELIAHVRELGSDVPAILITGYDFSGRTEKIETFENCEVMGKPVGLVDLSRRMREILEQE